MARERPLCRVSTLGRREELRPQEHRVAAVKPVRPRGGRSHISAAIPHAYARAAPGSVPLRWQRRMRADAGDRSRRGVAAVQRRAQMEPWRGPLRRPRPPLQRRPLLGRLAPLRGRSQSQRQAQGPARAAAALRRRRASKWNAVCLLAPAHTCSTSSNSAVPRSDRTRVEIHES